MPTHTLTSGYRGGSVSFSGTGGDYTSNTEICIQEDVPAGTTKTITFPGAGIDVSKIVSVGMMSTKAVTVKNNDDGSPDDTLALLAGKPVTWANDFLAVHPCPLTADVSSLKITNAGASDATFKIAILLDLD